MPAFAPVKTKSLAAYECRRLTQIDTVICCRFANVVKILPAIGDAWYAARPVTNDESATKMPNMTQLLRASRNFPPPLPFNVSYYAQRQTTEWRRAASVMLRYLLAGAAGGRHA